MGRIGNTITEAVRGAPIWEDLPPKVSIGYTSAWGKSTIVRVSCLGKMKSDMNNRQLAEAIMSSNLLASEVTEVVVVEAGWDDGEAKVLVILGLGD